MCATHRLMNRDWAVMILTNYFHSTCTHDGAKSLTIVSIKRGWLSIKTETNLANWPKSN